MCSDKRIGNQFLYPGLGYGGSCFPKDVLACISMGNQAHSPTALLGAVHEVNQKQRQAFLAKIERHFTAIAGTTGGGGKLSLVGKRVAIWGIAFKPGTDDIREAPSITIMQWLLERGATVVAYDPVAVEACKRVLADRITYASDSMGALQGAEALIVCTDWPEFAQPDFEAVRHAMREPVVFDGRNMYRTDHMRDLGFTYHSVGRHAVNAPKKSATKG
jgi:UDPglucose 6-dehydrogenase